MLHWILVILFAITVGFTASGITANSYRLIAAKKAESLTARTIYIAIMVVAGPNVLFENAARTYRKKGCSPVAFWLAAAVAGYWSFALGLFVLNVGLAL